MGEFKKVTDKRAGAGGPIVNEAGEPISAIPRKTITQEQILDKIAAHFKEKLERVEISTVGEYADLLKKEIDWADNLFRDSVERLPESGIEIPTKKQLTQLIAERAELLFIAETLETRGLQKICEDLVSRVKDAKNVSKADYESFLNRFVSGEEPIELIIRDVQLSKGERAGVNALLKQGETKDILELGRQFNAVKGFDYPTAGIRAWAWKKAEQVAKFNLTDLFGRANWAVDLVMHGKEAAPIGEHLAKHYEKKHAKFTRKVSILNIGKVTVAAAVVLGAGYLLSQCSSCVFGSSENEAGRSSVQKKKRTPVSPAEIELYKNPLFRAKGEDKTPKFIAIASHMTKMGLDDEEQVKVAKILNKLPGQFVRGMDLRESIELAIILRKLSPGVSIQKLADTVVSIQQYIDSSKTKDFTWTLVKSDKAKKGDVTYWIENPPYKKIMTEEWYTRPFPEFINAGFSENDKLLQGISATIRKIGIKQGREIVPLSASEQNNLAEELAEVYSKGKKNPKIPETYLEDLEFIMGMRSKGFGVPEATSILSQFKFVYDPKHSDAALDLVLKRLKPGMSENETRLAVEAPAFEKRGWASRAWNTSPDKRLLDLLTSARDAGKFSSQLRVLPQKEYEDSIETLESFAKLWQGEVRTLDAKKISEVVPPVIYLARSKALGHLSPDAKSQLLFQLVSKVEAPTRKSDPRAAALSHLEDTFRGKEPKVAEALAELDAYLEPEKAAE